jgi:hypothetical protein
VEFVARRVDSAILRITSSNEQTVATGVVEMKANLSIKRSSQQDFELA